MESGLAMAERENADVHARADIRRLVSHDACGFH